MNRGKRNGGIHRRSRVMLAGAVVALLALTVMVGGCGGGDDDSGSTTGTEDSGSKPINIAFLAGVVDASYTPAQEAGLREGSEGDLQIFNPEFDPTKQNEQCQDAIASQRYDAIVLTPLDNTSSIPCAAEAASAGIPLVVDGTAIGPDPNDLEPQVEGVIASVIYIPETLGDYTWDAIQKACADTDPCQVVMEISFAGDPLFEEMVKFVKAQTEGTGIEVVATYESQFDPAQTTASLRDILLANPGTNVVAFANDPTALAGAAVIDDLGKQDSIKVIGDGGTKKGLEAVEDGRFFGTIANYPQTASAIEGEMARQAVAEEEVAPSANAWQVGPISGLITKADAAQFEPQW